MGEEGAMKPGDRVKTKDGVGFLTNTKAKDIPKKHKDKGKRVEVWFTMGDYGYYKTLNELEPEPRLTLPPDPPPRKIFEIGDIVKTPEGVGLVTGYYGTVMGEYSSDPPPDANDEIETDRERIFYDVDIDGVEHSFVGSQMSELTVEEWQEWQNRSQKDSEKELVLSGSSR